jgi:hypothetical protein
MIVAIVWPRSCIRRVSRTSCISAPDIRAGVMTCNTRRRRGWLFRELIAMHELQSDKRT